MHAPPLQTFALTPTGPFSLAEANGFEFGHRKPEQGEAMTMAFAADGDHQPVGVVLRQAEMDGPVTGELHGDVPLEVVEPQVARILSLDHDGAAWAEVIAGDPVLKRMTEGMPGLRPVLFHSPYEAAAWSIISARRHTSQGAALRDRIADELGTAFTLDGRTMHAFPGPERLIDGLRAGDGLTDEHVNRLVGVARAAIDGDLDPAFLQSLGPEAATARLLDLKGIGPFYAMLIALRGTGFADCEPPAEPRFRAALGKAYGLDGPADDAQAAEIAERWKPFRMWASVTFRAAAARGLV
jgi:DNA-3-methyladenine glycosylase II